MVCSPQLEPKAIQHLCANLDIDTIFVDDAHHEKASEVCNDTRTLNIPNYHDKRPLEDGTEYMKADTISATAYYCHTSGTSSGLPKPIMQSQFGVIGALPRFPGEGKPATFSTTPLYHGGLPDCFRAWTSGAMIWFFPEGVVPITGSNLMRAINFAREVSPVPVKYYSSVPYVVQMLAEEEGGIELLRTMDLVGIGGAALPATVGDKLVQAGVNLLSRMGSAECGFLMSSHRDYATDKEWQYLRPIDDPKLLSFEPQEDGLSELVVRPGWPFMIKINRDDGSYATADLFEPHPTIPNAWRYHSRADAQIALANGKKFDPSPIEGSILASSSLLQDVLIFGSGRDYAGALLFPKSAEIAENKVIDTVWPHIEEMNFESQSHTRISKSMLVVISAEEGKPPLEKSSKGTILRRRAEERYTREIEWAYSSRNSLNGTPLQREVSDSQLESAVIDCFSQVLGRKVDPHQDLYRQGVDSIACIQIRKLLQSVCLPQGAPNLPMNIIYDQGTVAELTEYLRNIRNGDSSQASGAYGTQWLMMRKLAEKYSDFQNLNFDTRRKSGKVIVLTGATGFLGAHILHLLRQDPTVDRVFCLLRAQTRIAAHERVSKALSKRGMPDLGRFDDSSDHYGKIVCLPSNLFSPDLGISPQDRQQILEEATMVVHSAWTVNFTLHLKSFEHQVMGTRNLVDLAMEGGARFVFISSTAAVINSEKANIPERLSHDPWDASPLGYSRSKWVAEQVCSAARERIPSKSPKAGSGPISIIRVGQLCSNYAGYWNSSEAYPLMLSTANIAGCLPDVPNEVLNWMPVELAAQTVLDIAFPEDTSSPTCCDGRIPVYHVLNPHTRPTWRQMLKWIAADSSKHPFRIVPPSEWVERLEKALNNKESSHPSQGLLSMWKDRFGEDSNGGEDDDAATAQPVFDVALSSQASKTMREVKPLDRGRVVRMWKWIEESIRDKR